jgi:hypothetical protein
MRVLLGSFFVLAALLASPESSRDLHSRYGEPDIERFVVRPPIGLTVEYGSDGQACQMVIEGQKMLIGKEQPPKGMFPDVVSGILDEVAPLSVRGKGVGNAMESMGCSEVRIEEYENVWISRSTDNCLPLKPDREMGVRICFKRPSCPPNPFSLIAN